MNQQQINTKEGKPAEKPSRHKIKTRNIDPWTRSPENRSRSPEYANAINERQQAAKESVMLVLIGMPGSGKSTIGRLTARIMAVPFIDLDQHIEEKIGCSIAEFFAYEGEARFRDIESQALSEVSHTQPCVLSTGGGTVLRLANRQWLKERGEVVYLYATPAQLLPRLRLDKRRPLLQVNNPMQRLTELYEARNGLYRQTAHHVVETGACSTNTTVHMIVDALAAGLAHRAEPAAL